MEELRKIEVRANNGMTSMLDFAIVASPDKLVYAQVFDSTKYRASGLAAYTNSERNPILKLKEDYRTVAELRCSYEYGAYLVQASGNRMPFAASVIFCKSPEILVTAEEFLVEDMYNYFMSNYNLPMRNCADWMHYILDVAVERQYVTKNCHHYMAVPGRCMKLHGKEVPIESIIAIDFEHLTEEALKSIMSEGAKTRKLLLSDAEGYNPERVKDIEVEGIDQYLGKYIDTISKNTEESFQPLTGFAGKVEKLALKNKKPYPQQAMAVNAMTALMESGSKYGFIVAEMGTGKTMMGESFMETFGVKQAMKKYNASLEEVYRNPDMVNYRHIIMCPSHLVNTWAEDIKKEIPFAKVEILKNLKQLVAIRERGKARTNGREFYIIGKDTCKLGSSISPIPTLYKEVDIKEEVCSDCRREEHEIFVKQFGDTKCPNCGGKNWEKIKISRRPVKAMICPNCGEGLLAKVSMSMSVDEDDLRRMVLSPSSFTSHTSQNHKCYHCNSVLWGVDAENVNHFPDSVTKDYKWFKVKEYSSFSKKGTSTRFALKGYEDMAYKEPKLALGKAQYSRGRKVAPADYIAKYLKGYFDICVLDEVHKFEGAGTAQSRAAEALHKASRFTLGLTGTLTNGTAKSLFYLLFMLDPARMIKKGYQYTSAIEFTKKYGALETEFEYGGNSMEEYNSNSRGRQLTSQKVKPGISPLIYAEFLLDKAVFLNISDFSNFLPEFHEEVVLVDEYEDVLSSYRSAMGELKSYVRSVESGAALAGMLSLGLSYTDKPYGRLPIMATKSEGTVLANLDHLDRYEKCLLKKEEKLIEIVKKEVAEGRNMFIFATYTGKAEANITYRLKNVLEEHCNLKGAVQVMESSSPSAEKRAEWIHRKASEGVKVFICNPALVETGLDFKFDYEGKTYNYPTILFYQIDYKLATFWQASRRAFRLNQTEECRNYYFATNGTAQEMVLQIMTEKQMSASALQGNFSMEGLQAMSSSSDAQTLLIKSLLEESSDTSMDLASKFDVLNEASSNSEQLDSSVLEEYRSVKNFYELTGLNTDSLGEVASAEPVYAAGLFDTEDMEVSAVSTTVENIEKAAESFKKEEVAKDTPQNGFFDEDIFGGGFGTGFGLGDGFGFSDFGFGTAETSETANQTLDFNVEKAEEKSAKPKKKSRKKRNDFEAVMGQDSLFGVFGA